MLPVRWAAFLVLFAGYYAASSIIEQQNCDGTESCYINSEWLSHGRGTIGDCSRLLSVFKCSCDDALKVDDVTIHNHSCVFNGTGHRAGTVRCVLPPACAATSLPVYPDDLPLPTTILLFTC
jgi:hypothetical protein